MSAGNLVQIQKGTKIDPDTIEATEIRELPEVTTSGVDGKGGGEGLASYRSENGSEHCGKTVEALLDETTTPDSKKNWGGQTRSIRGGGWVKKTAGTLGGKALWTGALQYCSGFGRGGRVVGGQFEGSKYGRNILRSIDRVQKHFVNDQGENKGEGKTA